MLQYPYPIRLTPIWRKTMRQFSERFSSCRTQQEYTQVGIRFFRFFRWKVQIAFQFENGVTSNVGGCIGTACKSLKTVQAKQCSPQKSASVKRKAPYFKRSTVLFWWRIPGSNRWPLACHASALPNHLETHPQKSVCEWVWFGVNTPNSVEKCFSVQQSA